MLGGIMNNERPTTGVYIELSDEIIALIESDADIEFDFVWEEDENGATRGTLKRKNEQ
jgi:hypothetical protein